MAVVTSKTVWSILSSLVSTLLFVLLVTIWCCKVWVVSVSGSSKESFDETNQHCAVLMVIHIFPRNCSGYIDFFSANVWAAETWVHLIWKSLSYASVSGTIAQSWQGQWINGYELIVNKSTIELFHFHSQVPLIHWVILIITIQEILSFLLDFRKLPVMRELHQHLAQIRYSSVVS